jgi:hypothetical protein
VTRLADDQAAEQALGWVDAKIAAAVAEAPPLPDDLAARLVKLIRATPKVERAETA